MSRLQHAADIGIHSYQGDPVLLVDALPRTGLLGAFRTRCLPKVVVEVRALRKESAGAGASLHVPVTNNLICPESLSSFTFQLEIIFTLFSLRVGPWKCCCFGCSRESLMPSGYILGSICTILLSGVFDVYKVNKNKDAVGIQLNSTATRFLQL